MTIETLPLQEYIENEQTSTYKYRILNAEFGDGYSQTAPDGINNEIREVTVQYKNLKTTEYETVIGFLRGLKGAYKFKFTPHGETEQVWKVVPESLQTTVTAISYTDSSKIYRSIAFTARSAAAV